MSEKTFLREKDTNSVELSKDDIEILKTNCKDVEIKRVIRNWLKSNGWGSYNFGEILRATGIQLPVVLSNLNKKNYSFECTSKDGKSCTIELYSNTICITDGNVSNDYEISFDKDAAIPNAKLHFTQIDDEMDKVKVLNNYDQAEENLTLVRVDNNHTLNIKLSATNPIFPMEINNYLATLNADSINLYNVYATIINLFGAKACWNISIRYTESTEKSFKPKKEKKIIAARGSKWEYFDGNMSVTLYSTGKYEIHIKEQNIDNFENEVSFESMEEIIKKVEDIMKVLE